MTVCPNIENAAWEVAPFIDGALSSSRSEKTLEVINPSTGRYLFSIPAGCDTDVDHAVMRARRAYDDGRWSDASPSFRKKVLHTFADFIGYEAATFNRVDACEMGKPVSESFGSAAAAASLMRFYAEAVDKLTGDVYSSDRNSLVVQRRVPRGVIAAITPWNFPTVNAVRKIAPALAAGNCVVLKPSELSSQSAIRLAQLALQAGLPPGVLNVVPGAGEIVGRALAMHREVDMVTFTGSTTVGKAMLQYSAKSNLKVVLAECGGKSPQILFDDGVDLDAASESVARFIVTNQGQICSVGSRLLVERSIEGAVLEKITTQMRQVVIGNALEPKTTFGPIVSAKQCETVMQYIKGAGLEGAQLVHGGRRVLEETGGFFVEPTLFRDVPPTARIAQEEVFGPLLSVIPFEDEDEAVRIANGTMYGLAAYVWTADLSRGMRMAKAIRSAVHIGAVPPSGEGAGHAASSEPAGESGIGIETGLAGMESYLRRQLVSFRYA